MTDHTQTSLNFAYPVMTATPHKDGTVSLSVEVVNYDAEEKLKQILAEFQDIDLNTIDLNTTDIVDISQYPSKSPNYQITENNIDALLDYLAEAEVVSDEEADDIEIEEIQSRLEQLGADARNEILEKLTIQNGKIESIDWEEEPDRHNEQGQIIIGVYTQQYAQDLIDRINTDGFNPDGTPKYETDERQHDLF